MASMLTQEFITRCKLHKNLVDHLNIIYKPVYRPIEKTQNHSDVDFEVAEEYNGLVFYIQKVRNLFIALKYALGELDGDPESRDGPIRIKTREDWAEICGRQNIIDAGVSGDLRAMIEMPTFMWLKSVSEIPDNTEFIYLGEVDSILLRGEIEKFDVPFKKFAEVLIKREKKV